MPNEESNWSFTVVKGGSFSHTLIFEDDEGAPVDVSGKQPRMLVKYGQGGASILEWKRVDGYFTSLGPGDPEQFRFDLTLVQINALTFKVANYFFFLNGSDELLFTGTIQVK